MFNLGIKENDNRSIQNITPDKIYSNPRFHYGGFVGLCKHTPSYSDSLDSVWGKLYISWFSLSIQSHSEP